MRLRPASTLIAGFVVFSSLSVDAGQTSRRGGVDPFDELMWTSIGDSWGG